MKPLSRDNAHLGLFFPALIGFLGSLALFKLLEEHTVLRVFALLGGFALTAYWIHRQYLRAVILYYTDQHLIIKGQKTEQKVPLSQVTSIRRSSSRRRIMGITSYEYEIDYSLENGALNSVRFYTHDLDGSLSEFKVLVAKSMGDSPN